MDRTLVAKQLLALAKDILAMEFTTQEAMDRYQKEHPEADMAKHTLREQPSGKGSLYDYLHSKDTTPSRSKVRHQTPENVTKK